MSRLDNVINTKRVDPSFFEAGDLQLAKLLFRALLEAAKESSLDETLALNIGLFNNTSPKRGKKLNPKSSMVDSTATLEKLAAFLNSLPKARQLSRVELEMATETRKFFRGIYKDGGATAYEQSVSAEFAPL